MNINNKIVDKFIKIMYNIIRGEREFCGSLTLKINFFKGNLTTYEIDKKQTFKD